MSSDVRIDPEVSTTVVNDDPVQVLSLLLGGVPRGAVGVLAGSDGLDRVAATETMNALAQHGFESVLALDTASAPALERLLERLAERGWHEEQIAVIGYGDAARTAVEAAAAATYGAAVSIPLRADSLLQPHPVHDLRTPWLGLVGCGIARALPEELRNYEHELRGAATQHTRLVGYPGADSCLNDSIDASEHAAAFDAWQRTAEWLKAYVVPRPTPATQAWRERRDSLQSTH